MLTGRFGDAKPLPRFPLSPSADAVPGASWTGIYVGCHAGYGYGLANGTTTNGAGAPGGLAATESADTKMQGLFGGAQAGLNYEFSNRMVSALRAIMPGRSSMAIRTLTPRKPRC
jgi:hypothetical protein